MVASTSKLVRDIERENTQAVADAWEDRKRSHTKRPPKWCADHLLDVGAITPEQHDAAQRYASAIERGFGGDPLPAGVAERVARVVWDQTVAAEFARVARAQDRAQSREVARTARFAVLATLRRYKTARPSLDLLFGFNGLVVTGPHASWKMMRARGPGVSNAKQSETEIVRVLAALAEHFAVMDAGYGRIEWPA